MNDQGFDGNNISSYGFNWPTDPGVHANYYWNYLWAYGADYVNKDGTDIGFDNAGGRAGLKVMKDMVDSGATTPAKLFTDSNVAGEILLKGTAGSGWQILATQNLQFANNTGAVMAQTVLSIIPIALLLAFLQRAFTTGLTAGAVK